MAAEDNTIAEMTIFWMVVEWLVVGLGLPVFNLVALLEAAILIGFVWFDLGAKTWIEAGASSTIVESNFTFLKVDFDIVAVDMNFHLSVSKEQCCSSFRKTTPLCVDFIFFSPQSRKISVSFGRNRAKILVMVQ